MFAFLRLRQRGVGRAALLLGSAALASRFLGLIRDRIFAAEFGAGDTLDMYFAAFRIPDLIYNILIAGAISAAFIPIFLEEYQKRREYAWNIAANFLNVMAVVLGSLAFLGFIVMPWFVHLIVPGFSEEKREMTVLLSRIMLLSPVFFGISAVFSGVNQSFHRFLPYALAPILYNIGIIFGVLVLVPAWGTVGLAWGVVLGALAHLMIQFPPAIFAGYRFAPIFSVRLYEFIRMVRLMLPRAFGLAAIQINLWVMTAIASLLSVGSVAVFNFANNLQYLPIGIVGISFAVASFPTLSRAASGRKREEFLSTLSLVVRRILFLVLPLAVLMFILRAQIVRVVLGAGLFGWEDTRLTAAVLGIFTIGIVAHSVAPTIYRAFYATQDTLTPVMVSVGGIILNILLSVFFVFVLLQNGLSEILGQVLDIGDLSNTPLLGLPLAFSLSGIATAFVLFLVFFMRFRGAYQKEIISSFLRLTFLSALAGMVAFVTLRAILMISPLGLETFMGVLVQGFGAGTIGILSYILGLYALRFPERQFIQKLLSGIR